MLKIKGRRSNFKPGRFYSIDTFLSSVGLIIVNFLLGVTSAVIAIPIYSSISFGWLCFFITLRELIPAWKN